MKGQDSTKRDHGLIMIDPAIEEQILQEAAEELTSQFQDDDDGQEDELDGPQRPATGKKASFKDAVKAMNDPMSKYKEEEDEEEGEYQPPKPPPDQRIPSDFALRVATRITAINEREMDEQTASAKVAELIYRNMNQPFMFEYFIDALKILLKDPDTQKYAALSWVNLVWNEDEHPEYRQFIENVLKQVTKSHLYNLKDPFEDEETGKTFSAYAYAIGECFIQMMRQNSDLYDVITDMFSYVIRVEMTRDLNKKKKEEEEKQKKKSRMTKRKQTIQKQALNPKKLYDDVVDYIANRGEFRSDNLNQKNPNEFIIVLADRMRSTRRYVIQDIMNRYALEKKKQLEKELREREASAEEVITSARPFNQGLRLYWVEKRYNFKYLAVEKVRVTLQIIGLMMGIGLVGGSYMQMIDAELSESLAVAIMMVGFAKAFSSRYIFAPFYPKDVTTELEDDVGQFTPVLRKMSVAQLNSFLSKQVRADENQVLLHLLPEYVKYIFAVLPDRNNLILNKDEVQDAIERLEGLISRHQRGA